jgi:hypothetical protein
MPLYGLHPLHTNYTTGCSSAPRQIHVLATIIVGRTSSSPRRA